MPKIFISLLCICLLLGRCAKEYSNEGGSGQLPNDTTGHVEPDVPGLWEFKESNILFHGPVDTAWLTAEDNGQVITATGISVSGNETISIYIRSATGPIEKNKTYNTTLEQLKFVYSNQASTIYSAIPYYGGDIYFTVTDIGDKKIVGTFKGLAIDTNGRSLQITEGKFSSPLRTKPASQATGSVMLWAKEYCGGPNINVKVNNQPSVISKLSLITPQCGDEGRANYTLSPGNYSWVAYCGTDSVTGNVEVKANTCTKILVVFPFAPADTTTTKPNVTCKISRVSYTGKLLPAKLIANDIIANFSGNIVTSLSYSVLYGSTFITSEHPVNYEGDKIIIDKNTGYDKYFITDANGRVIEYSGDTDPSMGLPRSRPVKVKYKYDNSGNLIERDIENASNQTRLHEMKFSWENGNVVRISEEFPTTGMRKETSFDYYTDRVVNAMPWLNFSALELVMFQSVINIGNFIKNPIKRFTVTSFDASGNMMSTYSLDYKNYIVDNNNYVPGVSLADDFNQKNYYGFSYMCF